MKTVALCGAAAMFAAGCSSQPKMLRHYAELDAPQRTPQELTLSVFLATPRSAQDSPLVLSLSERAQAELIRSLAARMPEKGGAAELMGLLAQPTLPALGACAWANKTSMSKQLVFTLLGDLARPADRIDKLDIRLVLKPRVRPESPADLPKGTPLLFGATFSSWDRFTPEFLSYVIGEATLTQSNKFSAGTSRTGTNNLPEGAGSLVKALNLGFESDKTLAESAIYALRRLSVGGALTPTTAQLVQESGPNVNLFGSSSATISFKLTPGIPEPVYAFKLQREEQPVEPSKVRIERCSSLYPLSKLPIVAVVSGTALLREVSPADGALPVGDRTVPEGDDRIRLRTVRLSQSEIELASAAELEVLRFGLARCGPRSKLDECERLYIEENGVAAGGTEQILVDSIPEASALRNWLVAQTKQQTVKAVGGLAVGMAPGASASPTTAVALKGIDAATAAQLRVVRLGGNAPLSAKDSRETGRVRSVSPSAAGWPASPSAHAGAEESQRGARPALTSSSVRRR